MGVTTIKVACVDQRLMLIQAPEIASGGKNEDRVEFEFCPLWDGFTKTAVFYRTKEDPYHAKISDGKCTIPHEVLTPEGWLYFGVFGVKGDITRTTEVIPYPRRIKEGALTEGTKPSDPTPDIYAQILASVGALENKVAVLEDNPVTPEMYGAVGDGVNDDTAYLQAAVDSGKPVKLRRQYLVREPIRITRDHTVIDGMEAEIYVEGNFAFKVEARHFNLAIGKCRSVWGSGTINTVPIFPVGSGFLLFDANFDITPSDEYHYSYGYGNVHIGEAKFLQYGIRLAPEATDKMVGIEYTTFSGNDLWCEKCIDLSPITHDDKIPAWANQNTFTGFRLRGNFGIYIEPNVRWTAEGNTFHRCGLEGFNANGAGIYCDAVSNTFRDLRNAEAEALGENALWVNLGPNANQNKFEFYVLDISKCYVAPSEDNRNEFNCILTDGETVYHSESNCNYNYKGYFVAPDCKLQWIRATGAVGLGEYVATPVTIYSAPSESNIFVYLSPVYGHRGIDEFTLIIPADQTWTTFIVSPNGEFLHTFTSPGTYYLRYNGYTGKWDVHGADGMVLTDANGGRWQLRVGTDGTLSTVAAP